MAHLDHVAPSQCDQTLWAQKNADMLKPKRMTLRMRDEQDDRGLRETIKSRPSKNQDGLMSPLSGDGRQPASTEVSAEGYLLEEMMHLRGPRLPGWARRRRGRVGDMKWTMDQEAGRGDWYVDEEGDVRERGAPGGRGGWFEVKDWLITEDTGKWTIGRGHMDAAVKQSN